MTLLHPMLKNLGRAWSMGEEPLHESSDFSNMKQFLAGSNEDSKARQDSKAWQDSKVWPVNGSKEESV